MKPRDLMIGTVLGACLVGLSFPFAARADDRSQDEDAIKVIEQDRSSYND